MESKCCIDNKTQEEVNYTAKLLKIIAEENRLRILCTLKTGELCVCEIWKNLGIPQNLVSHHLKILKNAKLVDYRKEGLNVIYEINKKEMNKFNLLLNNFLHKYE